MKTLISVMERGLLPDALIRRGIRRLLVKRLRDQKVNDLERVELEKQELISELRRSPIAIATREANDQHYELPPEFFGLVLGKHRKYSSAHWGEGVRTLDDAEARMLDLTMQRADLHDGQRILELGCGWGSLSLWMARRMPNSEIVAVSNSAPQRKYLEGVCREEGITNLQILTADMNDFDAPGDFDRVVSVEMFEHLRNSERLMDRIAGWLRPGGKLFVHIFCHQSAAYPFEVEGPDDWMGRYFFTGGLMPSADLLLHFQNRLHIEQRWLVSGVHYAKTAEAWLDKIDENRSAVSELFADVYGEDRDRWLVRWRVFFLSCAELFGYRNGQEWLVGHYLFRKPEPAIGVDS